MSAEAPSKFPPPSPPCDCVPPVGLLVTPALGKLLVVVEPIIPPPEPPLSFFSSPHQTHAPPPPAETIKIESFDEDSSAIRPLLEDI